jgi:hypothetical protein
MAHIAKRILLLRGHRVLLTADLAVLYEVEPKALVQAVKRNIARFPDDFMFQLTWEESSRVSRRPESGNADPRSQTVTLKPGQNVKYLPYVFTEQGVAMLSSVLRSKRAIEVNIEIMRAFVRLREMLAGNRELAKRLTELEKKNDLKFVEHDAQFKVVFEAINQLLEPPTPPRRQLGFLPPKQKGLSR